jgi:glutamate synthase (NADPH/NADH) large chain
VCTEGSSDSASFDEVLELLHLGGRSLPHAVLMMIPEAWENHDEMDAARRAFYEYHANLMEPWDGPACLTFTDGALVGAVLDRNGLRPGRYWVTEDGLVVLASEAGVLDLDPATVVRKGRLEPGRMFLVDTGQGRIIEDDEVKGQLAAQRPYAQWVAEQSISLGSLPEREHVAHSPASVQRRQRAFGYTTEELKIILSPVANSGAEPLGAMGSDTPIAVLSKRPRLLFDYFTQMFAQVTNPPLDAIREELVTSIGGAIGPEPNLLDDTPEHARKVVVPFPVLDNDQLAKIVRIDRDERLEGTFRAVTIRGLYEVSGGGRALQERLEDIFAEVDGHIESGATHIVLSDRDSDSELAPIPSLLLTSAVHHHLLRRHTRTRISLLVEAGDVREVHHVALLIGYGAAAVNPYLAMETVEDLARRGYLDVSPEKAVANLIKALGKGVLKVMSKMGISTIMSYRGAQTFEAVGLSHELVEDYFTGTTSRLDGVGLDVIAAEVAARHAEAYPASGNHKPHQRLTTGGEYQWRRDGEEHLFDPETVFRLQHATRTGRMDVFRQYTRRVDEQSKRLMTLRGLLRFNPDREPVPIDEVEPVEEIVKRFNTGAMSYGSISAEAHETLAIAMNRLGGRSNTGEGGEDPDRLYDPERRSRVKQIASGRFGVTSEYLTNADDIQIKLAQGAKPGEGGQLPGPKVYPWVARTRHSTPGVGLISPPPHHDIYSIEDLAQLIHDAKNANPDARIHVKLVSEFGVGTVATGVSKAHADVVLISGHDGGTGASPLTSLKHAGTPWEIGLAETQQTLVLNNLRDRIVVQVDGQMKTGRDVVVAALLGAEEFGFATAPMVVSGCIMMRVCHLDTCPVGVATQNPELRRRFMGKPEFVVNFFEFVAQEVREHLASLGFRSIEEAIGQVQALDTRKAVDHWKAQGLDLAPVLARPEPAPGTALYQTRPQDHGLGKALDNQLIELARPALEDAVPVKVELPVRNVNRTVGTMLGHEVTKRYRGAGLPDDTIDVTLTGSAGQSLGAFLPRGVTVRLFGDANDYVGKGLSGGRIVARPDRAAVLDGAANVVAGNVIGYGATSGEIFLRGRVGERFGVRNSGATLVVEGVGDHGCEYMTGGTVLVLGPTGRNFGAGMSGGVAYVLDLRAAAMNTQAVASGELVVGPLEDDDWAHVCELMERHQAETGSPVAAALLADPQVRERFSRVLPVGWSRVRTALAEAEAAGTPLGEGDDFDPSLWEQIMEVARG